MVYCVGRISERVEDINLHAHMAGVGDSGTNRLANVPNVQEEDCVSGRWISKTLVFSALQVVCMQVGTCAWPHFGASVRTSLPRQPSSLTTSNP